MPKCPTCAKEVYFAEKVTSLGKDWHRGCLKCQRCNKTLSPGGHAEHDNKPYCNQPCYGVLFGPKGVNIGGAGAFVYEDKRRTRRQPFTIPQAREETLLYPKMPNCPKCNKAVYFAERYRSLGKDWHRACLRCEKCSKVLQPGSHAEHEGKPYCTKCYGVLYGPRGVNIGGVGSYAYDGEEIPPSQAPAT
ncbi:PREDICTED: cysteine-rich protein 2-like [Branchiostoma belcheri]|uniref:Cysteine-rich protein 2-like n=1 Tax=Branchiostoma belcheri TaxID=7741 RepID=A0A6P4XZ65_BRABE|nr:PREDICTED: cysteine-rich protein 2-like [Branchiostoma belcheri]